MKAIVVCFVFVMSFSSVGVATEGRSLEGAFGAVCLSSQHIASLDAWNEKKSEICLGAREDFLHPSIYAESCSGLVVSAAPIFSQNGSFEMLADVEFDNVVEDTGAPRELIAEIERPERCGQCVGTHRR